MVFFRSSFSSLSQDKVNVLATLAFSSAAGLSQVMGTIAEDDNNAQFPYAFLESLTFMTATALFRAQDAFRFENQEQTVCFIKSMQLGYSNLIGGGEIRVGSCVLSREILNVTISNDLFCKVIHYIIGDLQGLGIDEETLNSFCKSTGQRAIDDSFDTENLLFSIFQLRVLSIYASSCVIGPDKLSSVIRYTSDAKRVFREKIDSCLRE